MRMRTGYGCFTLMPAPDVAAAYSSGDMTQAGVAAVAKSVEELDYGGIAPEDIRAYDHRRVGRVSSA